MKKREKYLLGAVVALTAVLAVLAANNAALFQGRFSKIPTRFQAVGVAERKAEPKATRRSTATVPRVTQGDIKIPEPVEVSDTTASRICAVFSGRGYGASGLAYVAIESAARATYDNPALGDVLFRSIADRFNFAVDESSVGLERPATSFTDDFDAAFRGWMSYFNELLRLAGYCDELDMFPRNINDFPGVTVLPISGVILNSGYMQPRYDNDLNYASNEAIYHLKAFADEEEVQWNEVSFFIQTKDVELSNFQLRDINNDNLDIEIQNDLTYNEANNSYVGVINVRLREVQKYGPNSTRSYYLYADTTNLGNSNEDFVSTQAIRSNGTRTEATIIDNQ